MTVDDDWTPVDALHQSIVEPLQTDQDASALKRARCLGAPVSMFYTGSGYSDAVKHTRDAKQICQDCPEDVQFVCMVESFRALVDFGVVSDTGVWAGFTNRDRYRVRRWGSAAIFQCEECRLWATGIPPVKKTRCSLCRKKTK